LKNRQGQPLSLMNRYRRVLPQLDCTENTDTNAKSIPAANHVFIQTKTKSRVNLPLRNVERVWRDDSGKAHACRCEEELREPKLR
jgi:hypothetical protein